MPKKEEHIVVTVMGQDRVGIVAGVSTILAQSGANILDMTSTKMRDMFVMIILADISKSKMELKALQDKLRNKGKELGVHISAQHEDSGMVDAARAGSLSLEKLEAMTSVCSSGLDMIPLPGDTPEETIAAIIMDEMAIGIINNKPVGVRIIPVPGRKAGDHVKFGGLLGSSIVMPVSKFSSKTFARRGGQIPSPSASLRG
ncbi:MAG: ACT domain-containing protein [Thaumarchaeota archaeon]|nr:ACT domain-containing protein [Nitrososphaerota archaeon]